MYFPSVFLLGSEKDHDYWLTKSLFGCSFSMTNMEPSLKKLYIYIYKDVYIYISIFWLEPLPPLRVLLIMKCVAHEKHKVKRRICIGFDRSIRMTFAYKPNS